MRAVARRPRGTTGGPRGNGAAGGKRLESQRRVARGARVGPGARRFAGMVAEAEDGAADEHVDDASVAGKRQQQAMGAQVVAARHQHAAFPVAWAAAAGDLDVLVARSEEHTSALQSLTRLSYAVFCLRNKTQKNHSTNQTPD